MRPAFASPAAPVVIVLKGGHRVVGAVVDSVSDVLAFDRADIKPAPEMNSSMDTSYIMGIGCIRSGDVERTLIPTDKEAMMRGSERSLIDTELH